MDNQKNIRVFGYARVSSTGQNLDRQIVALESAGVKADNIVCDKVSGENLDRQGYNALKSSLGLRSGDVLVIKSLDRLSRNKNDIKQELEWFKQNKIRLKVIDLPTTMIEIDNNEWIIEMINNIIIEVLSSIAEQDRVTIKQRQKEGIAVAKLKGKHLGRPKVLIDEKEFARVYALWKDDKITAKSAMRELELSKTTFYALVKDFEQKNMASDCNL